MTQAQDEFLAAASIGLPRLSVKVLNTIFKGIKEYVTGASNPAGSNTQIQFNNNGAFGATSDLTWDANESALNATNLRADEVLYVNQIQGEDIDGFSLNGAFTNTNGAVAGSIEVVGGQFSNPNAGVTGTAGDVEIRGGSGPGLASVVDGGSVIIQGGAPQNGGAHGSVRIEDIELLRFETTTADTAPLFNVIPRTVTSSVSLDIGCVDGSSTANLLIEGYSTIYWVVDSSGRIFPRPGTTTQTDGFLYIPAAAGTPTGTPLVINGSVPLYFNTTGNELYAYNGGAWRKFSPA